MTMPPKAHDAAGHLVIPEGYYVLSPHGVPLEAGDLFTRAGLDRWIESSAARCTDYGFLYIRPVKNRI